MMRQRRSLPYANSNDLKAELVRVPFDKNYAMIIILPHENVRLIDVMEKVNEVGVDGLVTQLNGNEKKVELTMPIIDVTSEMKLNEAFETLGFADVFTDRADFSKLSRDHVYLSKIINKTKLKMNELGESQGDLVTEGDVEVHFKAYRPFGFLIVNELNSIIFSGQIYNPSN